MVIFPLTKMNITYICIPYALMCRSTYDLSVVNLSRGKRYPLSVSEDVMALFRQCHKEMRCRSIGASVKETILRLRRRLDENKESKYPSINPYTGKPLSKREIAHITHIQKEKGFETTREAFAYFLGHTEKEIEKRLAKTVNQTLDEAPQPKGPQIHPCPFYKYDNENDKVLCSKDFDKRGIIHRVPQAICDQCNEQRQLKKKNG